MVTHQDMHFIEHTIGCDELVCHSYPMRFHSMVVSVSVRPDVSYIE